MEVMPMVGVQQLNRMKSQLQSSIAGRSVIRLKNSISDVHSLYSDTSLDIPDYQPNAAGPLIDHAISANGKERDRYWVNAPYAFISIVYIPTDHHHEYHIVEPTLDARERELLGLVRNDIREPLLYRQAEDEDNATVVAETFRGLLERYAIDLDVESYYRLFYYLDRDFRGYGRLDPIMRDPHVEDISCEGYDLPLFVYHDQYTDLQTNLSFGSEALDQFVTRLAQLGGRHISIGDPVVETTLPDGSRAELALGEEVTPRGSAFTLRKYASDPLTPIDLVEHGTFDLDQMAYLWLAIEHNRNLIFAGGTASGKTTSMNAISMFIPPRSKVLTIEDTRELELHHDNWLSSVTRKRVQESSDVSMYDLLRSALRHRPEYIIVGEVRGGEAMTLFQAMNTGHTTYSTMHADSVHTVVNRLENDPLNVPRSMVQSLDILSIQVLTRLDDRRVRRNKLLVEIEGIDPRTGDLDYSTVFRWDMATDSFDERNSSILESIREERGWSQQELLTELERRRRFLKSLLDHGVSDFRSFTALVNRYYTNADDVISELEEVGQPKSEPTL